MHSCCNQHDNSEENKTTSEMEENHNLTEETDNKKEAVSDDMPTESNQPETLPKRMKIKLLPAVVSFLAAAVLIVFTSFNFSINFQLKPYSARLLGLTEN